MMKPGKACNIIVDDKSVNVMVKKMDDTNKRMEQAVKIVCERAAQEAVNWAKTNKKWTNRTSNAVNGLRNDVRWESKVKIVLSVYHTMDYGVWLELAHQKKYAILQQAIAAKADELFEGLEALLK